MIIEIFIVAIGIIFFIGLGIVAVMLAQGARQEYEDSKQRIIDFDKAFYAAIKRSEKRRKKEQELFEELKIKKKKKKEEST